MSQYYLDNSSGASGGGKVLQHVFSTTNTFIEIATAIPGDDTIPQISEGEEILTATITPLDTTNLLCIEAIINMAGSSAGPASIIALFVDATADALAAAQMYSFDPTNGMVFCVLRHYETAATTTARTYRLRAGPDIFNGGFKLAINGKAIPAASRLFGGVAVSSLSVTEIEA